MTTIEDRRAALLRRRAELADRLVALDRELDSHQTPDWEDLAAERETDEVLEGMGQQGERELHMIEAALARIEAGEYGHCAKCGAPIAPERLDILPWTPFCSRCAA